METWQALDLLARDQIKTFQELADEAFAELLEQPTSWPKRRAPEKRGPQRHRASPANPWASAASGMNGLAKMPAVRPRF